MADPAIGPSNLFSFNDAPGMCPDWQGLGRVSTVDVNSLVDRDLSLDDEALTVPNFNVGGWYWPIFAETGMRGPPRLWLTLSTGTVTSGMSTSR